MTSYKHTQIGYWILLVALVCAGFFLWLQITARAEPPTEDSGTNFTITTLMTLIIFALVSFSTLTVSLTGQSLEIRFGWGIFRQKIPLSEVVFARQVRNHWYYGWGVRFWFWPRMRIFNVSGLDAVEIVTKERRVYRIGTDEPERLMVAILKRCPECLSAGTLQK